MLRLLRNMVNLPMMNVLVMSLFLHLEEKRM